MVLAGCARPEARSGGDAHRGAGSRDAAVAPGAGAGANPVAGAQGSDNAREPAGLIEAFPHVRIDRGARIVEFDGIVPIDAHDPETPTVYLEVIVCTPDTKEHEALVVTEALPSHVHAALLLIGLEAGHPGSWTFDGDSINAVPPAGPGVDVTLTYTNAGGERLSAPAYDWIVNSEAGERLAPPADAPAWVFAGSRFVVRQGREWYDADGAGTLIGLTTFGGETIAWHEVISHDSTVQAPEWIADRERLPPFGTPVTVRLSPSQR